MADSQSVDWAAIIADPRFHEMVGDSMLINMISKQSKRSEGGIP